MNKNLQQQKINELIEDKITGSHIFSHQILNKQMQINNLKINMQFNKEELKRKKKQIQITANQLLPLLKIISTATQRLDYLSIHQMTGSKRPTQCLKTLMEGLAIIFSLSLHPIVYIPELPICRYFSIPYHKDSFQQSGRYMLGPYFDFLRNLRKFQQWVDRVNEETIQLLEPLVVHGSYWFNQILMNKCSKTMGIICRWILGVYNYYRKYHPIKKQKYLIQMLQTRISKQQKQLIEQQQKNIKKQTKLSLSMTLKKQE